MHSVGCSLTWTYLVHFTGKPIPEKQTVSISAFAHPYTMGTNAHRNSFADRLAASVLKGEPGVMSVSVAHTERTWGDDILWLVRNFFIRTSDGISPIQRFFREYLSIMIIVFFYCFS